MKRSVLLSLLTASALSSCYYAPPPQQTARDSKNLDSTPRYGYNNSGETVAQTETVKPKPKPKPTIEPQTQSEPRIEANLPEPTVDLDSPSTKVIETPEPPEPKPTSTESSLPYAKPIPGQPGRVYSPFNGKPVEVEGMSPGTRAICPYTGKHFRVP